MMRKLKNSVLILSGLALIYASSTRLVNPSNAIYLKPAIENSVNFLETNVDLINEIRGVGGVLLIGAIVTFLGVFISKLRLSSLIVSSVIFSGIVFGRLISFAVEGIPTTEIIRITTVEFFFCALNIFCLVKMYLRKNNGELRSITK